MGAEMPGDVMTELSWILCSTTFNEALTFIYWKQEKQGCLMLKNDACIVAWTICSWSVSQVKLRKDTVQFCLQRFYAISGFLPPLFLQSRLQILSYLGIQKFKNKYIQWVSLISWWFHIKRNRQKISCDKYILG